MKHNGLNKHLYEVWGLFIVVHWCLFTDLNTSYRPFLFCGLDNIFLKKNK